MKKTLYILAIESSCDDTAAAVLKNNEVLSNCIANQKIHQSYGGVVPELASRAHQANIIPVVQQALSIANIDKKQLSAIAYTRGPGLLGSLLVGSAFSKSLALSLDIPIIEVNHMQAHLLCHFIQNKNKKPVTSCKTIGYEFLKYSERDLNPHDHNDHWILSPTCLPIPPPEQSTERKTGFEPATLTLAR